MDWGVANYAISKPVQINLVSEEVAEEVQNGEEFKIWMCIVCGWLYEEEKGCPEEGIAPGTRWEDVADDWFCPDCGAGKEDFEMIEI